MEDQTLNQRLGPVSPLVPFIRHLHPCYWRFYTRGVDGRPEEPCTCGLDQVVEKVINGE